MNSPSLHNDVNSSFIQLAGEHHTIPNPLDSNKGTAYLRRTMEQLCVLLNLF